MFLTQRRYDIQRHLGAETVQEKKKNPHLVQHIVQCWNIIIMKLERQVGGRSCRSYTLC